MSVIVVMPALTPMTLNELRVKPAGFVAGTLHERGVDAVVSVSPLNETPNSLVAEFQATPGSRPNPADSVRCRRRRCRSD